MFSLPPAGSGTALKKDAVDPILHLMLIKQVCHVAP
jgi:hypothetical protein